MIQITAVLSLAASAAAAAVATTAGPPVTTSPPGQCYHDNCYRAAVGTAATGPANNYWSRLQNCTSFFQDTYVDYDQTTTVTKYSGAVTYTEEFSFTFQRTETVPPTSIHATSIPQTPTGPSGYLVTPTSIPPYAAKYCPNPERYSSACSCIGVQPTTRTVPGRTVTVTDAATTFQVVDPTRAPLAGLPCGTKLHFDTKYNCNQTVECNKVPSGGELLANYFEQDEYSCAKLFAENYYSAEIAFYSTEYGSCLIYSFVDSYVDGTGSDALVSANQFCQ